MNIQQLEYILAVKQQRSFVKAAAACFVTQPTLSAMIHKLEEELGLQIFDRTTNPVGTTEFGDLVINHAQKILHSIAELKDVAAHFNEKIQGEYNLAVIPTIAPSIMSSLVGLSELYSNLSLNVSELQTEILLEKLRSGEIHAAVAATPLFQKDMVEVPLYLEPLNVFVSSKETKIKKYVLPKDIQEQSVWMLEEGNCLSKQLEYICNLKNSKPKQRNFQIKTGSIETLLNLVEANKGITILPELFCRGLDEKRKTQLRKFKNPQPVRQVSLIYKKGAAKERLNNLIATHIVNYVQHLLPQNIKKENLYVVPIL